MILTSPGVSLTACSNLCTVASRPSLFFQVMSIWNIWVCTLLPWFMIICWILMLLNPRLTPTNWKLVPMCLLTSKSSFSVGVLSWILTKRGKAKLYLDINAHCIQSTNIRVCITVFFVMISLWVIDKKFWVPNQLKSLCVLLHFLPSFLHLGLCKWHV